jgi:hypothetical protein
MADNTKIWPIFRWANGGLSDDLFTGIKNSFYFSNDMEIREDAKSIFPKWVPAYADANKWIDVWDGVIRNVTYSREDWWWLVCCGSSVYLVNPNLWTSEELCTFWQKICDLEIFNGYIYISTVNYVYYKLDDWYYWDDVEAATDDSALYYGRMSQILKSNLNHPLYASDVCLCVWDTHKMWKVTKEIPNLLQEWFEIQNEYYIRFINELWWFIRVTAVDEPYGSEVLLWDKVSDTPTEVIPLEWYSMIGSAIYKWYHYLLSNKWLWLLNW